MKVKSIEIAFPDRYSICIINIDKFKLLKKNNYQKIIRSFMYDAYTFNQNACNSPHFVFWIGKKNKKKTEKFWEDLSNIVKTKNQFTEIDMINKYTHLCDQLVSKIQINNLRNYKNYVYVLNSQIKRNIEDVRGVNGIFYQKNIKNLSQLKKFISKKCQTMTYYGFNKNDFKNFLNSGDIHGVDRIVPIGKSMAIDLIWDGFDTIKSLSRIVNIS